MSKLIERIRKLGQSDETVIGFGSGGRAKQQPTILLIGRTPASGLKSVADTQVDAIIVEGHVDGAIPALEGKIWGVRAEKIDIDQAATLKEMGADFVVFVADSTDAAVLDVEGLAAVIVVEGNIEDEEARGLRSLSIDAALYIPNEELGDLSVTRLGQIQASRSSIGKPLIVAVPDSISSKDVETLRNAGIVGLLVDLASTDRIAELRETIDNLPRKRRPSDESSSPTVPFGVARSEAEHDEADEEDFDEDDY